MKTESPLPKLSPADPALKAVNTLAEILEPFDRQHQLKILANACIHLNDFEHARVFLDAAEAEETPASGDAAKHGRGR